MGGVDKMYNVPKLIMKQKKKKKIMSCTISENQTVDQLQRREMCTKSRLIDTVHTVFVFKNNLVQQIDIQQKIYITLATII